MHVSRNALTLARFAERLATGRMTAPEYEDQVQRQRKKGRGAIRRRTLKNMAKLFTRMQDRGWMQPAECARNIAEITAELASIRV